MSVPVPADGQCFNVVLGNTSHVVFGDCPNEETALAWAQDSVENYSQPLVVVQISSTVIQVVSSQVTVTTQTAAQARGDQ